MGTTTGISWCDSTWNPWRGCVEVSPACDHCYAREMSHRNPAVLGEWGEGTARVPAAESYWQLPFKWDRAARAAGERRRVFCLSLGDVFEQHPALDPLRERVFETVSRTPHLDWLLLTKRVDQVEETLDRLCWPSTGCPMFDQDGLGADCWANVWLGCTVENQEWADRRLPDLIKIPAAVRFVSYEPALGPVRFDRVACPNGPHLDQGYCALCCHDYDEDRWGTIDVLGPGAIHWVIAGGESGPGARPPHPEWFNSVLCQCDDAGAAFFFKQWGDWAPRLDPPDGNAIGSQETAWVSWDGKVSASRTRRCKSLMARVGKKKAGYLLVGRQWLQFPDAGFPQ
jgi:protein gp37